MSEQRDASRRGTLKIIALIAFLVVFFVILTCFYQVRETQAAVLTTFEKPVRSVTEPGLHGKLPWPIQKAYVFDLRSRLYQSPYGEFLVKDGFNVVARSFVCWAVKDVETYKNKVGVTIVSGEEIVATLVAKHVKSVLSEHPLSDLVGVEKNPKKNRFDAVENDVLSLLADEGRRQYGIEITLFGFDRLELPEGTTEAVFERMKSERMRRVEKILSEGKYEAERIKKEADSEKSRILAEAEAEAIRIRGKADTEAFERLSVYNRHPEFALFLKKLRALEETVKSKTTIVIDKDTPPFDMLSGAGVLGSAGAKTKPKGQ